MFQTSDDTPSIHLGLVANQYSVINRKPPLTPPLSEQYTVNCCGSCSPPLALVARVVSLSYVSSRYGYRQFIVRCSVIISHLYELDGSCTVLSVTSIMDPIMNSQPIKVIDAKGFNSFKYPRIVHNGYLYYFGKKCTNHLQWKCYRVVSLKCPAVLRTTTDMSEIMYISVDHEHVHANDLVKIKALKNKINEHKQSSLSR